MTHRPLAVALAVATLGTLAACGGTQGSAAEPTPPGTSPAPTPIEPSGTGTTPATLPLYVPPTDDGATTTPSATALAPLRPVTADATRTLPATVTSADGSPVTVDDATRIVPLWGNLSEIVFSLGLGDQVVARDASATFAEAAGLPLVTRGHDVSAESVLSQRPTVVLAQTDTGPPEALEQIRAAGVPVLVLDTPKSLDDAITRIDLLSTALGVPQAGAELAQRTADEIAAARASVPTGDAAPRIAFLYMRGTAGVYLLGGPGSGADSMIAAAGGIDAGTEMGLGRAFTPLTSEALVEAAPDVILMTTTGLASVGGVDGLVTIPGIAQTPAGRDRRVVTIEDGLLYSFGARTAQAIEEIVGQLYPDGS
ncbi:MAG TPA: ABC transporter substrate-binding protein [Ilumatobacter sp.]|nr:ABC transporter substrate-binding protein [Ilumatobacter sp.]